jgi:hypothetical protein
MLALKLGQSLTSNNATTINANTYSLRFNGTDEYVTVDSVVGDLEVTLGTISMWVKISTTTSTRTMFQARVDSNNYITLFYHAGSNELRFTYRAGGQSDVIASTDAIEGDGNWHHIAATWTTAGGGDISLYLDGVLKDDDSISGTWAGSVDVCDIAQDTTGNKYFLGNISEVGVFSRVVPIGELFTTVDSGPINLTGMTGLVGYWRFNEGSGTVAGDGSGLGNEGALINTPTWSTDTP